MERARETVPSRMDRSVRVRKSEDTDVYNVVVDA
jgi:hypothetical protein